MLYQPIALIGRILTHVYNSVEEQYCVKCKITSGSCIDRWFFAGSDTLETIFLSEETAMLLLALSFYRPPKKCLFRCTVIVGSFASTLSLR